MAFCFVLGIMGEQYPTISQSTWVRSAISKSHIIIYSIHYHIFRVSVSSSINANIKHGLKPVKAFLFYLTCFITTT